MQSNPRLGDHIRNALVRPFHKGLPTIEARKYISFYEEDESWNDTLLKFAKIDFNRVQLIHRQELSILSRWWNDLNFAEEFPYARDRIVEVYVWANGIHFEPQYAFSRMMVMKYIKIISLVVRNGLATCTYGVIMAASFLGMDEVAGGEEYEWLKSNPKIIKAGKMIGRLRNDVVGHEDEQKRGDCASGVECYMKQNDVSEKKAIEEIQKMDVNVWKDINEDCMRPTNAPMLLLQHFVNLVRVTDVVYANGEAYTIPLGLKDYVALLYIEQVPLYE
ncbi:hypothetical protein POTOM_058917 [Populus tomentosa]|uniref:Terpene synthase metal-binding domain-containing protein n=1 Tax=Populus tomentosa TaxID=118781 RepID=A0A8X7XSQ7_POPTO|nr:hypothetical protein POTOM_058917 [Populus tomentosa]